jgi:hypothetical protein
MDDFDRERPDRSGDPYGRRRETRQDSAPGDPIRRRPDYSDEPEFEPRRRPSRESRRAQPEDTERRPTRSTRSGDDREARPERYSDRFRRQRRAVEDEPDDRSFRSSRDPYDRLRRVGNRPPRRADVVADEEFDVDEYGLDEQDLDPGLGRARRRTTRQHAPRIDQQRFRDVGAVFANPAPELRPLVLGGLVAVGSLILLSILVLIRSGSTGDWIPLHLNAEGTPTGFGTKGALWRFPFFAFLTTVMAFGLGWWLRTREAYAVQYLVVGTLLIHCLIWVGAINLLW